MCVCVCVCAFMSRKAFCYTHEHRSCAVSVPGACDLSTIIRIDIEEELISIFTHAFGHLGNKITVGEDYGSWFWTGEPMSLVYSWSTNQPGTTGTHINTKHKLKEIV